MKLHLTLIRPALVGAPFVAPPRSGLGAKKGPLCTFLVLPLLLLLAASAAFAWDDENSQARDSRRKVADFMGGVLGKSGIVTGRNTGVTSDGIRVSYNGRGFATSRGYYGSSGNQTWGKDTLVVRSGQRFYGTRSVWRNGRSYTDQDGNSVWITTSSNSDK